MMQGQRQYAGLFSKVRALYAKRLRPEDYQRMKAFRSLPELVAFLKRHPGWRDHLSSIDETTVRRGYLEMVLNRGFLEEYGRFQAFIPARDRPLFGYVIQRAEIELILSFLRHFAIHDLEHFTSNLPAQFEHWSRIDLSLMQNSFDYQQMLGALSNTEYLDIMKRLAPPEGEEVDYNAIELVLWQGYYEKMEKLICKNYKGSVRKTLLDYFGGQADLENISRVIRLKNNFDVETDDIFDYLLSFHYKVQNDFLRALFDAQGTDTTLALLLKSPYRRIFSPRALRYINEYLYECAALANRRRIFLTPPTVFLGILYLDLRAMEIKNLTQVIESVRYGASLEKLRLH